MFSKSVFSVGIAGPTGSGKSTFVKMLSRRFHNQILQIPSDMYYKDQSNLPPKERNKANMDCPQSMDLNLLLEHIKKLKSNQPIEQPIYDFASHARKSETLLLTPKPVIIVEGLLILNPKKLRQQFDLKIYIEVDSDLRLARRVLRDVLEKRSPTLEAAINQYLTSARPMNKIYVEPQKDFADLIVPWDKMDKEAVETVAARIKEMLPK